MNWQRLLRLVVTMLVLGLWPAAGEAGTPLNAVRYTPDITTVLGGLTVSSDDVAEDNLAGGVALVLAGAFSGVRIDGYAPVPGGVEYLSFDTTVSLPGGVTAGPADLVRFDRGSFVLAFTGAAAEVPAGLRIDGVQRLGNGHLLLSFDGSGMVGGVSFDDEDVLEHDPLAGTWQLVYDGSQHAGWPAADLAAFAAALTCDIDGDQDVDRADVNAIFAARNTAAGRGTRGTWTATG